MIDTMLEKLPERLPETSFGSTVEVVNLRSERVGGLHFAFGGLVVADFRHVDA